MATGRCYLIRADAKRWWSSQFLRWDERAGLPFSGITGVRWFAPYAPAISQVSVYGVKHEHHSSVIWERERDQLLVPGRPYDSAMGNDYVLTEVRGLRRRLGRLLCILRSVVSTGGEHDGPSGGWLGPLGSWRGPALTPRHASAIAPIMVNEQWLEHRGLSPIELRKTGRAFSSLARASPVR